MNWTKIMECVPNFSEGRDLQKIDEIVSPFRSRQAGTPFMGLHWRERN